MTEETHRFDLVVVGGGPAGMCAALAAARCGARTAIVQDRPVFGGCSSSEIRMKICGSINFNTWSKETGIIEELLLDDRASNPLQLFNSGVGNGHWDLTIYSAIRQQANLTPFLNTHVTDVEAVGEPAARRILAVSGFQMGAERRLRFEAAQFLDCTGDGTVGALAGAEFRMGREARSEFGETLAPVAADSVTMGSSVLLQARRYPFPVPYQAPEWAPRYESLEEIGPHRVPDFPRADVFGGYWWIEIGAPYNTIHDNEAIKDEGIRHALGVWHYVKNHGPDRERAACYGLEQVGMVTGKRESRRLVGDVLLTEQDCFEDRGWPDRVCYSGWFLDIHINGGILNKNEPGELSHGDLNYRYYTRIAPFSVPLRALYSRNVDNLWMAGRNISVTRAALASTRVMATCANIGQAAGTAAATAVAAGVTPRAVADPLGPHLRAIQQRLLADDVNIPGLLNEDPADLARGSAVRASSQATLDFGEALGVSVALDTPRAQVIPFSEDRVDSAEVHLVNTGRGGASIRADLQLVDTIWQSTDGRTVASASASLPAAWQGWVRLDFGGVRVPPGSLLRLVLRSAPGVSWSKGSRKEAGTTAQYLYTSPGGCEPHNAGIPSLQEPQIHLPAFSRWIQHKGFLIPISVPCFATRITPRSSPFGPENVVNGKAWPEDGPNLWVSDPAAGFPQELTLELRRPARLSGALLKLDTFLDENTSHREPLWRALTCVRDWNLFAETAEGWKLVYSERDNYQRLRRVRFAPVQTRCVKVEVLATNKQGLDPARYASYPQPEVDGGDSARVYEVRLYA